jgi:hypothetical protein
MASEAELENQLVLTLALDRQLADANASSLSDLTVLGNFQSRQPGNT